jgi:sirohydrochlorin ferrochelatase
MSPSASAARPDILLLDNGSLQPAAVFSLRAIAAQLGTELGRPVEPVSLLHSSAIPADQLAGTAAEILEPALERRLQAGIADFLIVPLFFGPSGALNDYLPARVRLLKAQYPRLQVRLASPLVDLTAPPDHRLAGLLEDRVRSATPAADTPPAVILVDHGSPVPQVARVRDHLAAQLRARLGPSARCVVAASMERRPEPEYSFNEPLLGRALESLGFESGRVIVAPLFFSPGRHAGPGGDIAQICAATGQRHPQLRITIAGLVGSHPALIPLLADRARSGLAAGLL